MQRVQGCPGVVQLLDCFEDAEHCHLVTELVAGGDLKKYVEVSALALLCAWEMVWGHSGLCGGLGSTATWSGSWWLEGTSRSMLR